MKNNPSHAPTITGVVTARPCTCCGHHEIGLVTPSGDYVALKPGMRVGILDEGEKAEREP